MTTTTTTTKHSTTNPFGAARPREEVLASKGIDFHVVDDKVEEKARHQNDDAPHPHPPSPPPYASHLNNTTASGGNIRQPFLLTPDHVAEVERHNRAVHDSHNNKNTTPHKMHSAEKVVDDDDDDDGATHETASTSTTHTHATLSTVHSHPPPHHSSNHRASPDPFGNARPREEVLADKGVDARAVDEKIDRRAGGDEEHVFAGHHAAATTATGGGASLLLRQDVRTANLVQHNHPNYQPAAVVQPTSPPPPTSPPKAKPKPKAKINPFGNARPREEVLADHGVDYHSVDRRVDNKIEAEHLTPEQDAQAEVIRLELIKAEDAYWDANEKEMPEEKLRLVMEEKRRELHDLLERFQEINLRERQKAKKKQREEDKEEGRTRQQDDEGRKEYHVQGETRSVASSSAAPPYHRDHGAAHGRRNLDQEQDDAGGEYHGGDARRYDNVERPAYAGRSRGSRYDDRYDNSDRHPYAYSGAGRGGRGERGRGRGGRGYGGRGGRYGGRGGYQRPATRGGGGYGGGQRGYYDGGEPRRERYRSGHHRYEEHEHWSLCD